MIRPMIRCLKGKSFCDRYDDLQLSRAAIMTEMGTG